MLMSGCSSNDDQHSSVLRSGQQEEANPDRGSSGHLDSWWSGLTQAQRNQAIINRGLQQLGQVSGQSCKEWVRTVVSDASRGAVLLPPTQPNGWQWYSNAHVRLVAQNMCLSNAVPGHIVQMCLRSGLPHTAIVYSAGSWGMTWLDANWVNYNHPVGTVATHSLTWAQFNQQVASFSCYEIIG